MKALVTFDREMALLLSDCERRGLSGILTCGRGKLKRLFCIEDGRLSVALSNVVEEQFTEHLVRAGHLDRGGVAAARQACEGQPELKLGRLLVEQGVVASETMELALAEHVRQLLYETLDWTDGQCRLERGRPDLAGQRTLRMPIASELFDYARWRPESLELVRMRIGPPDVRPAFLSEAEPLLDDLELGDAARHLLEHCDGSRRLTALLENSPRPPEPTLRALYGLMLAGVLVPDLRRAEERAQPAGGVTRDEVAARLQRAETADHYGVLELAQTASVDDIRAAYYFLARRYHPDRFRTGPLEDLFQPIEQFFTQVTEAYNTLSDPALRESYDQLRAQSAQPQRVEQNTRELARQNYLRGRVLIDKGRYTDAVTSLENAIQLDANEAKYHLELGRLLAGNPRRRADAETHLQRTNQLDPALVDGYLALGELYVKLERKEEAAGLFREVLRWEPGHLQATDRLKELGADGAGGRLRGLFGG